MLSGFNDRLRRMNVGRVPHPFHSHIVEWVGDHIPDHPSPAPQKFEGQVPLP
jgi:hypothetical protein